MTDLLERLRAVNPVRTCVPPTIHDVWSRLEHDDRAALDAAHLGTSGPGRQQRPMRAFIRALFWLRHAGLGLTVAVPVLVAGLAIVLLGHNQTRHHPLPGGRPSAPTHRVHFNPATRPARIRIHAALRRGIRPLAPDVSMALPLLGSSGTRNLGSFRGKVVVLNVFASWCEPCKAQTLALERAQAHLAGQQATVLGVTYRDTLSAAKAFVRAEHITYPVLRDPSGRFVRAFGTTGVPETFLIDRLGRITAVRRYQADDRWLEQTLARVLASSGSADPVSPAGLPIKSPPSTAALAAMANAYPVLGHRQQPADIPPYGALDSPYVVSQGGLVAHSRRALVTPRGESIYLVPAHQSICTVSSDNVVQGCGAFPTTPNHAVAIGSTICAPNLSPSEIEVSAVMPPGASNVQAHYSNGRSEHVTATNGVIAIYARRTGPLPTSISWTDQGHQHAGTGIPPGTASSNCAS